MFQTNKSRCHPQGWHHFNFEARETVMRECPRRDGAVALYDDHDDQDLIIIEPIVTGFVPNPNNHCTCSCGMSLTPSSWRCIATDAVELVCGRCHRVHGLIQLETRVHRWVSSVVTLDQQQIDISIAKQQCVTAGDAPHYFPPGPFAGLPRAHYRAAHADPPWRFRAWSHRGESRSPCHHYPCQSLDEICSLPVGELMAPDAAVFLWVTQPM